MRWLPALLLATSAVWAQADAFERDLGSVKRLAALRKWRKGREQLAQLLDAHKARGYVRAKRAAIERLMKSLVFRERYGFPVPKDVVSGELLRWDPSTGKLKLRYTADGTRDFKTLGEFMVHGASFLGPHSITVKGRSYPGRGIGQEILVCATGKEHLLVVFGTKGHRPGPRVLYYKKGRVKETVGATRDSICVAAAEFTLRVEVGKRIVVGYFNNKPEVKGKKRAGLWGFVGLRKDMPVDEIVVEGRTDKAWMQGLLDNADSRRLKSFKWHPAEHLPAWLLEAAPSDKESG